MRTDTHLEALASDARELKWHVATNCHDGLPFCTWLYVDGSRACSVMSSGFDTYRVSPLTQEAFEVTGDLDDARREAEAWAMARSRATQGEAA